MAKRRPSRAQIRSVAGAIGPGDGVDPRLATGGSRRGAMASRKTMQLCNQIFETLEQVFGEQEDEVLQSLHVLSVVPAPDDTNVLVTVSPGPGLSLNELASVQERLQTATKDLRMEVAAAITRRKVPGLAWRVE